jgi:alkanesulfonate monooxygenase SsuD/methylene tetrahydromethanopterin reductase-like flavin-dependent oxidoreductase (luciferase family)
MPTGRRSIAAITAPRRAAPRPSRGGPREAIRRHEQARSVIARDHHSIFGTPDRVCRRTAQLSAVGFDGAAIIFVNYLQDLPYFVQEVLPRLENLKLRQPVPSVRLAS